MIVAAAAEMDRNVVEARIDGGQVGIVVAAYQFFNEIQLWYNYSAEG